MIQEGEGKCKTLRFALRGFPACVPQAQGCAATACGRKASSLNTLLKFHSPPAEQSLVPIKLPLFQPGCSDKKRQKPNKNCLKAG